MAANARLNNKFLEDEKCHNLMSWLKYVFFPKFVSGLGLTVLILLIWMQISFINIQQLQN